MKTLIIIFALSLPWTLELVPKTERIRQYLKTHKVVFFIIDFVLTILNIPTSILGYGLYYLSKPIKALGYLLLKANHSAKEEITNWNFYTEIADEL